MKNTKEIWKELCKAYKAKYDSNHIYGLDHPINAYIEMLENYIGKGVVFTYPDGSVYDVVNDYFTLYDAYVAFDTEPIEIN